ncbi:MAG: histidine triad nucleotide-binding protein [Candidatus Velthaea sp.]
MATSDPNCIFCKIVRREIAAREVLRDEYVVAFHDLSPVAPAHVLVVPTLHAADLSDFVAGEQPETLARLLRAAAEIGARLGPKGYRVVANTGSDGGQTVHHLHVHVLAGRQMTWPPG